MANPKSNLPTPTIFMIFFLLLITNVKSDSFSFNFPKFESNSESIIVDGDVACLSDGAIQLTKKDETGKPLQHIVGLAGFYGTVHLFDKKSGKVADFATEFTFVVDPKGSGLHGDGFTIFLASLGFEFPENNSSGGFLGLFDEQTAFNTSKNSIVAVEFDSFSNDWDPHPQTQFPHIGIDVNSITSVATVPWPSEAQPQGSIAKALITYKADTKLLSVFVTYPHSSVKADASLSYPVDFTTALSSEWVLIGFTASTGDLVQTHDILSWSFKSFL